jgi:hypothetical protein
VSLSGTVTLPPRDRPLNTRSASSLLSASVEGFFGVAVETQVRIQCRHVVDLVCWLLKESSSGKSVRSGSVLSIAFPVELISNQLQVAALFPEFHFDRPYFDAPKPGRRPPGSNLNSFVEIPCVDQEEATQLFLCLGKRSVCHRNLA